MLDLKQFGFLALWSPYFFLFISLFTILFFYIAIKKRHLFPGKEPITVWESIGFIFTMLLVYIVKGSPIDLLGHLMFTFHMVQMAILNLVIPPLLILFVPDWMWQRIITLPFIRQIFRFFTKPIVALLFFNGMFSFYHVPLIFDFMKTDIIYHSTYTLFLFIVAFFMWWPLLNKVEKKQLNGLQKAFYLVADSVLITPACALIIFSPQAFYESYTNVEVWLQSLALCVPVRTLENLNLPGPEIFNLLPAHVDQQAGGVIMKVLQEIIYATVLYRSIKEWFRQEREKELTSTYDRWN